MRLLWHNVLACVMGDLDLVRPLGLAGIRSVVVASPGDPALYSRFVRKELSWIDTVTTTEDRVDALMRFGAAQPEPPILFYQADSQLLLVSRYRERLAGAFRFVLAESELVEGLIDKSRFQDLAQCLGLPVPPGQTINPHSTRIEEIHISFPVVIKPFQDKDREAWKSTAGAGKALLVNSREKLKELWPRLIDANLCLLVQEAIVGPESCIESYHVYVDQNSAIVAEFTGRKIRTYPSSCGHSTALETTDAPDVKEQGRSIVQKLNLRGVAKFDFKRGPDGRLFLLEINPRFNLWHHLGAKAGVNLPALVYGDLIGLPRPTSLTARAGVRWSKPWSDVRAAHAYGVPAVEWLYWTLMCEVKSAMAWDDPIPLMREALAPLIRRAFGTQP